MSIFERLLRLCLATLRREVFEIGKKGESPYLTRWTLWGKRFSGKKNVFLHLFHCGDRDPYFHDHPWPFWSLILWGGYWEHTESGRRWYGPGSLLKRPADWRHRVELDGGKKCLTVVWCGEKVRSWGFWCPEGFKPWRDFARSQEAGNSGCD